MLLREILIYFRLVYEPTFFAFVFAEFFLYLFVFRVLFSREDSLDIINFSWFSYR